MKEGKHETYLKMNLLISMDLAELARAESTGWERHPRLLNGGLSLYTVGPLCRVLHHLRKEINHVYPYSFPFMGSRHFETDFPRTLQKDGKGVGIYSE
jgi:hypothetical protein